MFSISESLDGDTCGGSIDRRRGRHHRTGKFTSLPRRGERSLRPTQLAPGMTSSVIDYSTSTVQGMPNTHVVHMPDAAQAASRYHAQSEFYLRIGLQVLCSNETGIIRYLGTVDFTDGLWVGLELRHPRGRHDGTVAGRRYFTCRPGHGIVVRPSRITCRGLNGAKLLPPHLASLDSPFGTNGKQTNGRPSVVVAERATETSSV